MIRRWLLGTTALILLAATALRPVRATDRPIGFAPGSRADQSWAEAKALAVPTPNQARDCLRLLTEEPHPAGSEADRRTAEFVLDSLRSWGWQAEIAEYEVLLNTPLPGTVSLTLLRPDRQSLKVTEDPLIADKDSADPTAFPAFHGYGVSGRVSGQVVYANYGRPEDFDTLENRGVPVRDKIVLVRYGEIFRGLKLLNAQRRGAAGLLIYSDPADDGYAKGDVYPNGPFRPESAIQRGSVQFLSLGPGDPSTPGWASVRGAKRLPTDPQNGFPLENLNRKAWEKETGLSRLDYFPAIPSLPISYESARPILTALGGPTVPAGWQGGLPLTYHVGPGPAEVEFSIQMEYRVQPIWNVIARLEGQVEPDRWVLLSNHRDAWVYGAVDPGSGTASTLETCRALGEAVRAGWKPRRTIVFCSWDAEEYALIGSTEWAEDHAQELDEKALLMLNVDSGVAGDDLDFDGIPSLRDLVLEAAGDVTDIRSGRPLRDLWTERQRGQWAERGPIDLDNTVWNDTDSEPAPELPEPPFTPRLNPLGSGSDYTTFVDHLGVPAVDIGFKGKYGVYHSIYDDFFWMEKFGDPEFLNHATAAKLFTLIVMRAAGADIVPLRFVPYAEALRAEVDDLRRQVLRQARSAAADTSRTPLTFKPLPDLIAAVRRFRDQAAQLDHATSALADRDDLARADLRPVNDALSHLERSFLLPEGLPGRPWFRHALYAPGLTTGYASWPLPGVRQAIVQNDPAMLSAQTALLIARLDAATAALKAATEAAEHAAQ